MTQLSLFGERSEQTTAQTAVLVRSHLRRVKGSTVASPAPQSLVAAPHNGTATSRAAARAVERSGQAATQLEQVRRIICASGSRGTTRADIAHKMGLPQSTVCARVAKLVEAGLVRETDQPRLPDCGGRIRQGVLVAQEVGL